MNVGFVGLGNMGGLMVPHLLEAGHRVAVYDISPPAMERMRLLGAIPVGDAGAAAAAGGIVFTSLPTPSVVESVYLGPGGFLESVSAGRIFVDLSSITPALARRLAERLAEKGAAMLDAPVSGGTAGARAGTLAIMVGGDADALARVEPVLQCIGRRIFHVGPVGAGSTAKLLNQVLIGVNNMAVMEMLALARRTGIDLSMVGEIITASSGFSRAFERGFWKGVQRHFDCSFAVDLMAKDLRLAIALSQDLGAELPMASLALSRYERTSAQGLGREDIVAALKLLEE